MSYDKEKIKEFHKYTLEDYNSSLEVEKIAKVRYVERTDGFFTQIGIRPIVYDDIFISPTFHPDLPGAGRMVAVGETDFLIRTILDKKEIKHIKFKEDIEEFTKYVFHPSVILLSTKFYVEVFSKLMRSIDFEKGYLRLYGIYKIIPISEKILGNKIIIIDEDAILWHKQVFDNKITGKKEKIDINIKPAKSAGKVDITIRSLNKIVDIDSKKIKVLEIEGSGQKL